MTRMTYGCVIFLAMSMIPASRADERKFYDDDPMRVEVQLDTPKEPAAIELSDLYDRLGNTFHDFGNEERGEALNVNTVDEVPDSSWFSNRHGVRRMSLDELVRGPNRGEAPSIDETWTVSRGKSQGLTPGFEITDARGTRYVIKLDPVGFPDLSSAAEVIATKIFYAMGYNVPENSIVRFDPDKLVVAEGAQAEDRFGDAVSLTKRRLSRMLRHVPRLPDGRIRAMASKYVDGQTLGPFRYHGTRTDDPNDIVAHEDRRELRGLRLFSAWLNHDDTRAHNTQDSWVTENGTRYVKHHLIDFGSAFGSGTVDLQLPNLSFHYWFDAGLIKKNALGFGFHVPKYRKVEWPHFDEYRSVGRWESTYFDPEEWRSDYPNPAFVRMTARDAFWAAKILMRFTAKELRAIVETGEYSSSEEASYFYETLVVRQRKSGALGMSGTNPVDGFRVTGNQFEFENLAELYAFAEPRTTYTVSWFVYDNADGSIEGIESPLSSTATRVALPRRARPVRLASAASPPRGLPGPTGLSETELLLAEIRSEHPSFPAWNHPVGVYLRFNGDGYDVVGVERGHAGTMTER